jgi:diguanylate cyclase (GGDEF)-like protein
MARLLYSIGSAHGDLGGNFASIPPKLKLFPHTLLASGFQRTRMFCSAVPSWIDRLPCPVLVIAMDDSHVLFANRCARERLGVNADAGASALFDDPADLVRLLETLRKSGDATAATVRLKSAGGGLLSAQAEAQWAEIDGRGGAVVAFGGLEAHPSVPPNAGLLPVDSADRERLERQLHEANARLEAQVLENRALREKLSDLAVRDPLTGLFNRGYMEEILRRELSHSAREDRPLSLVIMDIDDFEHLNDNHGYRAGDRVLKALAGLLRDRMRGEDLACRFGGGEFVVILPGTPLTTAAQHAESWRAAFQELSIDYEDAVLQCTLSMGVAEFPRHGSTGDELLFQADSALYMAKRAGRNRVVVWG